MAGMEEIVQNLRMELRRGTLVMCVLSQLKEAQYGYSLIQGLTNKGVQMDQNTLYPLLRRLEKQGLLDSSWSVDEARPRKYYVLNEQGLLVLNSLVKEWSAMHLTISALLNFEEGDEYDARLD